MSDNRLWRSTHPAAYAARLAERATPQKPLRSAGSATLDVAIALLDAWSKGHREALLTVEATAALQRLKRK